MENRELREFFNQINIVGTLKENNLEYYTLTDGREAIRGNVVIEVIDGERAHNHKLDVFSMKLKSNGEVSGLYSGYETVMNEYKSKDKYGEDADRVSATGSIDTNDYVTNSTGEFVSRNQLKGLFFNRLKEPTPDRAVADIEMLIGSRNMEPVLDSDGLPSGDYLLRGYSVGYFNKKTGRNQIIPIHKLVVSENLYQQIQPVYTYGSVVRVSIALNNYAIVKKQEAPQATFGETVDLNVTKEFVNEYRLIGGQMPYTDDKALTDEEKVLVEKYRQQDIDDKKGIGKVSDFATVDNNNMAFTDNSNTNDIPDFF